MTCPGVSVQKVDNGVSVCRYEIRKFVNETIFKCCQYTQSLK